MHYILSAGNDSELFRRNFAENPALCAEEIKVLPLPDAQGDSSYAALFNAFFNRLPADADGWLLLCRENLEFTAAPVPKLAGLDHKCLYGVFGARPAKNLRRQTLCEFIGRLVEDLDEQNPDNPQLYHYKVTGGSFRDGTEVEALGWPCLILHSSLVLGPEFASLRFDENLRSGLFIDDFCRTAREQYGIPAKALQLEFILHAGPERRSMAELAADYERCQEKHQPAATGESPAPLCPAEPAALKFTFFSRDEVVLPVDHVWRTRPDVYHSAVNRHNFNHSTPLAASFMREKAIILDVGCAHGDNGLYFKDNLQASLWGIEYDARSIAAARVRNIYNELFQEDLETLCLSDFSRFYRFFTHIFIGDVLEHLRSPREALKKCLELLEPDGSIIVSLPNVGHAYVIAGLAAGEFEYTANGILDQTHLRFFTAKSQAELYAGCGLAVKNAVATFMIPNEYKQWCMDLDLPLPLYRHILGNRHFLTMQYVCELEKSGLKTERLLRHNLERIGRAPDNNPQGWGQKQKAFETLQGLLDSIHSGR